MSILAVRSYATIIEEIQAFWTRWKSPSFKLYLVQPISILVKALVWFWIIVETLVLTSILSVCRLNEVGTCQVMEQVMIMVMMVMNTR